MKCQVLFSDRIRKISPVWFADFTQSVLKVILSVLKANTASDNLAPVFLIFSRK